MSWAVGEDIHRDRDIGYGVPSVCDAPGCNVEIDRGLSYVCGDEPYGGEVGCGLFFCGKHRSYWRGDKQVCKRCARYQPPYKRWKPDTEEWIQHKLTDESWAKWRADNPKWLAQQTAPSPVDEAFRELKQ